MASASAPPISAQHQKFADLYLVYFEGKKAAIEAGCSPRSAKVTASRWLDRPDVIAYLAAKRAELSAAAGVTQERVIKELAAIGFTGMTELASWSADEVKFRSSQELPGEAAQAIAEVTAEVNEKIVDDGAEGAPDTMFRTTKLRLRQHDKVRALELLGKHFGLFPNRTEISVDNVRARLTETIRIIRAELPAAAAEQLIAKLRRAWA